MSRHSRAHVRSQRERYINRWRHILLTIWRERPYARYRTFGEDHGDFARYVHDQAVLRAGTRRTCSCRMCGNPRKWGALYKGERWSLEDEMAC